MLLLQNIVSFFCYQHHLWVYQFTVCNLTSVCELSSLKLVQSANWQSASWHICKLSSNPSTTQQPFYSPLSGSTWVSRYWRNIPDHHPIFISFFHLPRSTASSLFKLHSWQSFFTTSVHVLFGLPLGLEPSTSYSIYFFTQSVSSFHNTYPYHRNLFCCSINIISSIPNLSLNSLLGTLPFTLTQAQQHTMTVLWPFVRDYPGEPVPEETLTHPPSWSSSNLYQHKCLKFMLKYHSGTSNYISTL